MDSSHNHTRTLFTALCAILMAMLLLTATAAAQTFVYLNDNIPFNGPNSVTSYVTNPDGTLTKLATTPTGGLGVNTSVIVASDNAAVCIGGMLFAGNHGSNNVSAFTINPQTGALTPVPGSPFATGGSSGSPGTSGMSLACTPDGRFLIVSNAASSNITVFSIGANGALTPVAGSPFASGGIPVGIQVTPNGQFLAAALQGGGVRMFTIAANGALTPVGPAVAGGALTDVAINAAGTLLFAADGAGGSTRVRVYTIGAGGTLTPIAGSPFIFTGGGQSSNLVLSPDGRFLFVNDDVNGTIATLAVAADGSLTQVAGSPIATGGTTEGLAVNRAGTLLFATNYSGGGVRTFSIAPSGQLTQITGSPFLSGSGPAPTGLALFEVPSLPPSDQKAGSVLVFPYYTSTVDGKASDTLIQISNVCNGASVSGGVPNYSYLHLFFMKDCSPADTYACITPNGSLQILASVYDPGVTGYLIAVAVDSQGRPTQNNCFIGSAFVRDDVNSIADSYGAEAFWKFTPGAAPVSGGSATINLDGASYDAAPLQFSVQVQDPSVADESIVLASISGNLGTALSATSQSGVGLLYRADEAPASFQPQIGTGCFSVTLLDKSKIRIVPGNYDSFLKDSYGYLKFNVSSPAVGLLISKQGASVNYPNNRFSGIRTLHKTQVGSATLISPIFPPFCIF